ncbi:hypothetical protein GQ602_005175 [Ophiocordyceps camponoti-floridani]|uniref:DUF7924 domain-containing protein n=1 Tax=Ophiocordyceps camponoti-floridani TaxID=2030778 RepID=A0A8H4VCQ7_9HYPO|nr:hypothetical protein GQ602_005175 [Ophiocordyceps camponoti-floridani]
MASLTMQQAAENGTLKKHDGSARGTKRFANALHDDLEPPKKRPSPSADRDVNPVDFWVRKGKWPREYFELTMDHLRAEKTSASVGRKRSSLVSSSTATPSDQKPREVKTAPYRDPRYETLLGTKGSYMEMLSPRIADASKEFCITLLETPQSTPKDSLFRDDVFEVFCHKLRFKNEARVIQDISRLVVPSAETLDTLGAKHLDILTESVNEGWNNSLPLIGARPQPDYSVGFRREAFTEDQLVRLSPFIGDYLEGDRSFFMSTYYMYFPFLTCEVKCGAASLDIADRQNAHSMTLAVRAVAELFGGVRRAEEVDRQILGFSVSHDDQNVRIYGHYPVFQGKQIKYYRHLIHSFNMVALDGKER